MQYSSIIGQSEAKERIIGMVNSGRIPHALLFTGKEGCGNLPTAIAMASHLLCKQPTEQGACGICPACAKVDKLVHPDLHMVFPIAKTKYITNSDHKIIEFREAYLANPYLSLNDWFLEAGAENKQPSIPVDQAEEILRKLSYTSYEGTYKIVVIWQPEKMTTEAANKLLKIIEEPTEQTIFIMVCNAPEQLLTTIISRVQQIPFRPDSDEVIAQGLIDKFSVNAAVANSAALLAGGNFGEALKLLRETDGSVSVLKDFQDFMRLALRFDANKAVQWVDENAPKGREKHKQFIQYALEIFREALMYNFGNKNLLRMKSDERGFLDKFAPFINQKNYEVLVEEFNSNYYYIERNANPKILFMDLLLKSNEYINRK
jgi:DNA polymerase-3 subunit delta'